MWYIHRLVALHFIPNPDNKSQINHKDGNKSNNIVTNLVYAGSRDNVILTMINGKILYRNGEFLIDEDVESIYDKVTKIGERIENTLGISKDVISTNR